MSDTVLVVGPATVVKAPALNVMVCWLASWNRIKTRSPVAGIIKV